MPKNMPVLFCCIFAGDFFVPIFDLLETVHLEIKIWGRVLAEFLKESQQRLNFVDSDGANLRSRANF
jgi:hypothetical protein